MAEVCVRALYVYPVKGCGGGAVDELVLTDTGIRGDREFCFVGEDGRLVDQKKTPMLASIRAEMLNGELRLHHIPQHGTQHHRTESSFSHQPRSEGERLAAKWVLDEFAGIDQGDEIAQWVSNIIDKPVRCIRAADPWIVNFPVPSMKRVHGKPKQKFTAATDVSLTNLASLAALNGDLDSPIDMDRFRSNVVVDGIAAYAEDHMDLLVNDTVELMQVTPAERCEIITTDQSTGERPPNNILQVLGRTRFKTVDRFGTGLLFGNYMRVSKPGVLRVGDCLTLRDMTVEERQAAEA